MREGDDGGSKDDGEYAARVDFERDIGTLTAVLLSAFDLLGVLNGNLALGLIDENDKSEYDDYHKHETEEFPDRGFRAGEGFF